MESDIEIEFVYSYHLVHSRPFIIQKEEIDSLRFWSKYEIKRNIGKAIFTQNFEDEFMRFSQ